MSEVVIVAAVRTPMGSFGGSLSSLSAPALGSAAIAGALNKAGLSPDQVDEVFFGNVLQAGIGQAPARQAAIGAGIPDAVPCTTVNKVCASGMKSVALAAQAIAVGDIEVAVAGGMESMSNVPHYAHLRNGTKLGDVKFKDGLVLDGLTDVYNQYHMGNAAELCASEHSITREEQDAFALSSYDRSQAAWAQGLFKEEIVPVSVPQRRGEPIIVDEDEEYKNVKREKVPTLRPVFAKEGTVTAANASMLNDGAAALVVMSRKKAEELGLEVLAVVTGHADAAQAPERFTTAPAKAIPIAMNKAGITKDQVDFYEINEAFSVVSLANNKLLELSADKVNVNGGAVSLGHPLGCSGARILVTLIHVLKQNNAKVGVAGICNGGGGASAMVLQR